MLQQQQPSPPPQQPAIAQPSPQNRTERSTSSDLERGYIFHRNREQPTPDTNDPPINQIKFYLDRYKIKEALQIFFDETTLKLLRVESDFMWDVIPIICKRLRGLCQYRFRVFEGCERILCRIAVDENCNPKEVLIGLLAELSQQDQYDDDNVFRAMIRPLEGTLLRMNHPSPRDENLRWVLNVLMRHMHDIELPQDYYLDGKKRPALPNDPNIKRFIEVLPLMLSFIEEFNDQPTNYDKSPMPILTESQIDEVFNGELVDDDLLNEPSPTRGDSLSACVTALSTIMYKPLAFLDLTTYCVDLSEIANKYLNSLLKLRPSLFAPIYKRLSHKATTTDIADSLGSIDGICNESTISLANCSYLYRCERTELIETTQPFPQLITHESMLTCHTPYIVSLLERSEILVHEKGLLLLDSLLRCLDHNTLDKKFLDMFQTSTLFKQLFQIMVFSPLCSNRRRAYELFIQICDLLNQECKLKLFKHVLTQTDLRPCVKAACIDQYRKHLTLDCKPISGSVLELLDLCIKTCLPDSQHTDIIENHEVLLATLTILRFLKLRRTEVDGEYLSGQRLKKLFFDPVRNAIALIMNELKDIVEGHKVNDRKELNEKDEADCLKWALCRLDLVESVLVRTCEIYNC